MVSLISLTYKLENYYTHLKVMTTPLYIILLTITILGHAMPVRSLCFSPDSQLLITASDDKDMKIYDV